MCFILPAMGGCSKPPTPPVTLTQAHEKFLKLLDEEYELDVVTRALNNTMWIYLPMEEDLFNFKASQEGAKYATEATKTHAVNFVDGQFEDHVFKIQFDITPSKKYAKTFGYSTGYSKPYSAKQRKILTALSRSYFEVEENSRDNKVPDFFVMVIADITKGIETKMLFHFKDLKRGMLDPSFYEEYTRRIVVEDTTGHTDIIGDRAGKHLDFEEITWPLFLTKQILYRIRVKYQRSNFPPSENTAEELLKIAAKTLEAYDFTDFRSVELHNLDNDTVNTVSKSELEKFKTEEQPSQGKLHTIKFVY